MQEERIGDFAVVKVNKKSLISIQHSRTQLYSKIFSSSYVEPRNFFLFSE